MCQLIRCPNCLRYAATGCNDPEHREQQMARVQPHQRCRCREEQMAQLAQRDAALLTTQSPA